MRVTNHYHNNTVVRPVSVSSSTVILCKQMICFLIKRAMIFLQNQNKTIEMIHIIVVSKQVTIVLWSTKKIILHRNLQYKVTGNVVESFITLILLQRALQYNRVYS